MKKSAIVSLVLVAAIGGCSGPDLKPGDKETYTSDTTYDGGHQPTIIQRWYILRASGAHEFEGTQTVVEHGVTLGTGDGGGFQRGGFGSFAHSSGEGVGE